MQIDINEVSFKIFDKRQLEVYVDDQQIISIDTVDGGLTLGDNNELGNFEEDEDGSIKFVLASEGEPEQEVVHTKPVLDRILEALERIEQKL